MLFSYYTYLQYSLVAMVRTTLVTYFYVVIANILKQLKNYYGATIAKLTRRDLTQFVDIFVIIYSCNSEISWINAYLENEVK